MNQFSITDRKKERLGHLFEFAEGEDLLHNEKFSIESDSYSVDAKIVDKVND